MRTLNLAVFCSLLLIPFQSHSEPRLKMTKKGPTPVLKKIKKEVPQKNNTLWDNWYTASIHDPSYKKPIAYMYYNEKVEEKGTDIHFESHVWKKEEGFINEEIIGSFSENTPELKPLYYHFRQTYRTSEIVIDGSLGENSVLTAIIKNAEKNLGTMKRHVPKKVFLSSMFPVWIGKNLKTIQSSSNSKSFMTIQEDNVGQKLKLESGLVRVEEADDYAKQHKATKLHVKYQGLTSYWWVHNIGYAIKIEIPSQNLVLEKTTEEKAKNFFQSQ